ncbi:MAG TPA: hypothetical protein VGM77_06090 [Gemmatimonadales bacterium]|jgi:prefoldin subunit 5
MVEIFVLLMALGGGAYWLTHIRKRRNTYGTLDGQIAVLAEQIKQLREAQWQMRTAVDTLREEQDFRQQLLTPPERKV